MPPPSVEYSTNAPASTLLRVSAALDVILSLPELPVSAVKATPGVAGGVVSSMKVKTVAVETLPATSVCRA